MDTEVKINDAELTQYLRELLSDWDHSSLVEYAFDSLWQEYCGTDAKSIIEEMTEYYGEEWLRRKKLETFK